MMMKITPEAVYTWIVSLVAIKVVFFIAVNVSVFSVLQFFKLFGHLVEQYFDSNILLLFKFRILSCGHFQTL